MNRERLLHLIEVLKTAQERDDWEETFDMAYYWREVSHFDCGFAGCALGWAAMDPQFIKEGWKVIDKQPVLQYGDGSYEVSQEDGSMEFFDISQTGYLFLFEPTWYRSYNLNEFHFRSDENKFVPENLFFNQKITPSDVIKRIEFYLEHGDDLYCPMYE